MLALLLAVAVAVSSDTAIVKGTAEVNVWDRQRVSHPEGGVSYVWAPGVKFKAPNYRVMAYNADLGRCDPEMFQRFLTIWERHLVAETETDDEGQYTLELPPGTYLIIAMHPEGRYLAHPKQDRSKKRYGRYQLLSVKAGREYLWPLSGAYITLPPDTKKTP